MEPVANNNLTQIVRREHDRTTVDATEERLFSLLHMAMTSPDWMDLEGVEQSDLLFEVHQLVRLKRALENEYALLKSQKAETVTDNTVCAVAA